MKAQNSLSKFFLLIFLNLIFKVVGDIYLILLSNIEISYNLFWSILTIFTYVFTLLLIVLFINRIKRKKADLILPIFTLILAFYYMFLNKSELITSGVINDSFIHQIISSDYYLYTLWAENIIIFTFYVWFLFKEGKNLLKH